MGSASALRFHDVRVNLGGRPVLDGITVEIKAGEFVGLLGANGAGKTTFLRAALGLLAPQQGHIHVLGRPARRGNPAIGYVPQTRSAIGHVSLSGWDFVASVMNGHRLGLPWLGKAARREIDRVLDLVGARTLARRKLAQLSGGERQRLLLAQALVGHPRLLLLDEPLISLDPHHVGEIVELVRSLQTALGISVVFSAHELNPLLSALDRVLYLGGGRAAIGSVDEVITGPTLSRLYGADIEVVRVGGRIFVMSGQQDMERDMHLHEAGHEAGHEARA